MRLDYGYGVQTKIQWVVTGPPQPKIDPHVSVRYEDGLVAWLRVLTEKAQSRSLFHIVR